MNVKDIFCISLYTVIIKLSIVYQFVISFGVFYIITPTYRNCFHQEYTSSLKSNKTKGKLILKVSIKYALLKDKDCIFHVFYTNLITQTYSRGQTADDQHNFYFVQGNFVGNFSIDGREGQLSDAVRGQGVTEKAQ